MQRTRLHIAQLFAAFVVVAILISLPSYSAASRAEPITHNSAPANWQIFLPLLLNPTGPIVCSSSVSFGGTSNADTCNPIPYDCPDTLSPIAQAVFDKVKVLEPDQEYCGNDFDINDGLIILPPGEPAFRRFDLLASTAHYEVDFTTMIWEEGDEEEDDVDEDDAGQIFLTGVKELYDKVQDPVGNNLPADYFSSGVHVRILVGLWKYTLGTGQDQRVLIMRDMAALHIPHNDSNWTVEVAYYRDGGALGTHSHVKTMIVDGDTVIVGGYNVQNDYLDDELDRRDIGVQVSGPIALRALKVFDGLWMGANRCDSYIFHLCWDDDNEITNIFHNPAMSLTPTETTKIGNDVVFSLFRDDNSKTSDDAIVAAINAANSNVNIIQDHFINGYYAVTPYARAMLDILEKQGTQVKVKLIVSGNIITIGLSKNGICDLRKKLNNENPTRLQNFEARSSRFDVHTKALSIDNSFLIVGSQNFDRSAWGNTNADYDLAEYNLAIDGTSGASKFNTKFTSEFSHANSVPIVCGSNSVALQDEIDQAEAGSIIAIPAGVYTESLTINKPLVLVGAGADRTIFHPEGDEPAFRITSSDVTIMNMKISGGAGYGIELIDSSPSSLKNIRIYRVVFENNERGGMLLIQGLIPGSPVNYTIDNNTFIGGADGITINMLETQAETSFILNNIFFGQSQAPIHILSADDSRVEYSYNLFDNCGLDPCAANWRLGNLSAVSSAHDHLFDLDPLFSSLEHGAYQLSAGSPAIDAGDPSLLHDLYYDGDNDGIVRIDLGAFEYAPIANIAPVLNAGDDQSVDFGNSLTLNTSYPDADDAEDHSARIDWGDGMVEDVPANSTGIGTGEVAGQHLYASAGIYTAEICVVDLHGGVGCDTITIAVLHHFTGFFRPLDNQPALNVVKAGSAIPIKFSLDGDQGLNIFAVGYPVSAMVSCGSSLEDASEQTVTAGGSALAYDAGADQYIYVWKTDKSWAGTCRTFVLKLNDGSYHRAEFQFKE